MKILGIDTSCDDTCMALLENGRIIKNLISSQISLHSEFGGVVPDLAKRTHEKNIKIVFDKVTQSRDRIYPVSTIDVIAITQGPGLAPALQVGINFAKDLAKKYNKKIVAVNHVEGHLLSPFLNQQISDDLPILVLTVSGGHTMLVLIEKIGKYKIIGQTLDDAAGEALDKASKMLGLGYPGGPILEKLAKTGDSKFLDLPIPLVAHPGYDFSFSGLKTSVFYKLKGLDEKYKIKNLYNIAASFQSAVARHLIRQTEKAAKDFAPKMIFGVGGVMSNNFMRKELRKLAKKFNLPVYFPYSKKLNTDNAAMIAYAGYHKALRGEFVEDPERLDREPRKGF